MREHVKPRLLGHWGTTAGLNFIYAHLNRCIAQRDLDMMYVMGPGHGGPGPVAAAWLEGTYTEVYSDVSQDEAGMRRLFTQFSFPGGIPSHVAPETPGSIHEGGELGYALSHAYGAAFDNPDLIVAAVVGDAGTEPDVVLGCAGDVPTMEVLAATQILREWFPDLRVRVVNVVDLMRLQDHREHPHGLSDLEFDALFTTDRPIIFAYHGYPWLIHRLTYRRTNHDQLHVRGYVEEGTTTTPFDMCVLNRIDRFSLAIDVIDRVPRLQGISAHHREHLRNKLIEHRQHIRTHGEDMPEVRDWQWSMAQGRPRVWRTRS